MSGRPKVALLIEISRGYERQMSRGIARYARVHGPWDFCLTPGDLEHAMREMQQWGGTGIIARIKTPRIAKAILNSGLPAIALDLPRWELEASRPLSCLSEVVADSVGAARAAAEHFLGRGFHHFAFVGIAGRVWCQRREAAFQQSIRDVGFPVEVYKEPSARHDQVWERERPFLAEWLRRLPKPIGLMACNDERGREVLEACRATEIRVPEDVAVIGVDNDELLCEMANPPLSSVALNAEGTGYRTAALLDRMMRNRLHEPQRLISEALSVVVRRSADMVAIDDPEVAKALRFIYDHATDPIQMEDVVQHVVISRRSLEARFQKAIGRSPHCELQRVRLQRALYVLEKTNLSIPKVAHAVGYNTPNYFIQLFRKEHGISPSSYRRRTRTPDEG